MIGGAFAFKLVLCWSVAFHGVYRTPFFLSLFSRLPGLTQMRQIPVDTHACGTRGHSNPAPGPDPTGARLPLRQERAVPAHSPARSTPVPVLACRDSSSADPADHVRSPFRPAAGDHSPALQNICRNGQKPGPWLCLWVKVFRVSQRCEHGILKDLGSNQRDMLPCGQTHPGYISTQDALQTGCILLEKTLEIRPRLPFISVLPSLYSSILWSLRRGSV